VKKFLRALLVLVLFWRPRDRTDDTPPVEEGGPEEGRPFRREVGARPHAEGGVVALLLGSAVASVAFVVLLFTDANTQALGIALALALGLLGAALALAANALVPREQAIEERPALAHAEAQPPVERRLRSTTEGVSRRRLLGVAGATAGTTLAAAVAAPLTSIGPAVGDSIVDTPWRRGRRLVGEDGRPLLADDVPSTSFVTAFPEGADRRELGSPIVVVREDPASLRLPRGRREWAPEGIVAYSKICTHAGCALALYRRPLYEPTSEPPGIACPCHYSVFDPRTGGTVVAGPAGRDLPQLPLQIGPRRELLAGGGFSGPIGPSWWSVRHT
jgi:ubiquinol-cytochrome c reductase iron-sulfur subunit